MGRTGQRLVALAALVVGLAACDADGGGAGGGGADTTSGDAAGATLQFIDLRVEEIAPQRAVVRFDTSRPATCEVAFGRALDALDRRATDPSMSPDALSIAHEVPLEDLAPDTTYWYRGVATDAAGVTFRSETLSFETPAENGGGAALEDVATLAEGASVVAVSSVFGGGGSDSTWTADHAIDGQMATEWSSAGDGDDAFIEIDLGRERTLSHVGFRSRSMPDGSAIVRSFTVSFDGAAPVGPFESPDPTRAYRFPLDAPVTARRVRVDAEETTGGNTGAREVELLRAR